jgi:hypothetical protein
VYSDDAEHIAIRSWLQKLEQLADDKTSRGVTSLNRRQQGKRKSKSEARVHDPRVKAWPTPIHTSHLFTQRHNTTTLVLHSIHLDHTAYSWSKKPLREHFPSLVT